MQGTSICRPQPQGWIRNLASTSGFARSHLQHGGRDVGQVAAQEARVRLGDLDEQLERLLRGRLVAGLQRAPDHAQLRRDRALEAVPLPRVVQLLRGM